MSYKPVDTAIVMVVGPCIDNTDFKSLEEAIAYDAAGMDVSLIVEKTDGTTAVTAITLTTAGTSDWTHKDGGYYEVEITAAQNAEEGIAYVRGVCTGVLPFESIHYNVVKANVYDSWIKGTDVLQTDVTQWLGTAAATPTVAGVPEVDVTHMAGGVQTVTDLKDFADSGYDPATNKVQGVVLVDTTTTNTDMVGTDNAALAATALTDVTWTDAKAAFIDHSIATVDTNLDTLLTRITAARAGYLDNLSAGAVALSATALSDVTWTDAKAAFLDHSIATVDGNVDTLLTRVTAAVALASALATAQTDLDTITGADGVTLATAQALYAPNKVVPDVAGTAAGLHSTTDGLVTTVDTVVDAILVDTGTTIPGTITTLQTDSTAIKAKTDNLPDGIKKNTAITAFTFLMVDSTDHVTAKTGLTVAGNYSGDGGAVAALTNTGAITEISNGLYEIDLTAGELNYEHITLIFTASGADARVITIHTST